MYRAIHITVNQTAHDIDISGPADIIATLGRRHIESLGAHDTLDFWFSPAVAGARRLNIVATDLFVTATTRFAANNAPLFYGDVVVTSHSPGGELADLTPDQIDGLRAGLDWRSEWILGWRYEFAARRAKRTGRSWVCSHSDWSHRAF